MLRSIQVKIVLMFLALGIVMIGLMGYVNYANLQRLSDEVITDNQDADYVIIQEYQEQQKLITIYTILIFTLISLLVRDICYSKSNSTY